MTGVIDDVRKILTVADASALAKARSDFEHYVAQLKAEGIAVRSAAARSG